MKKEEGNLINFMEALKNHYNQEYIGKISDAIFSVYSGFDKNRFHCKIFDDKWHNKELKARMCHISEVLRVLLPNDYEKAVTILMEATPKMKEVSKHSGFLNMFCPDFVENYGLDSWELSMQALKEFTKYSSSEFAIRLFIKKDQDRAMKQMQKWTKSENYHVRRLASEGCRPRLPWAIALNEFKKDPALILPILEALKDDESQYVRRSVANNLNDIAKDNPRIVIDIAKKWLGENEKRDKLLKHACRTLLKAGNQEVLAIFGYDGDIEVKEFKVHAEKIKIGENLVFELTVDVKKPAKIRLEYAIYYLKLNKKHSAKVFQIKEGFVKKGEIFLSKKHSLRQMTTRKHYAGEHLLSLIINGKEQKKLSFFLE